MNKALLAFRLVSSEIIVIMIVLFASTSVNNCVLSRCEQIYLKEITSRLLTSFSVLKTVEKEDFLEQEFVFRTKLSVNYVV